MITVITAVLIATSGVAVVTEGTAFAQSSCTNGSDFQNTKGYPATVPTVGAATHQANCELGVGNISTGVVYLQESLNTCYGYHLALDGNYGSMTQAAVEHVQSVTHITVDGIYGPQTRNAMQWAPPNVPGACSKLVQPLVPR
jgi:peptidoglycan hydrolase-like protein with peptidoglycan-binding domain